MGHFTVSAGEYAGLVALDDVHGALSVGLGGVAAQGAVNVHMSTGEDLSVYPFGDVHGRYHAERDASAVTHGSFSGSLTADRDIDSGHYDCYGVPGVWVRDSRMALF
ncbi:MAG: hypothetical protein ACODAD_03580 [Planctomycetota bacterium]